LRFPIALKSTEVKILIADKQPLAVAGLTSFIRERPEMTILGYVLEAKDLSLQLEQLQPDVLIADYNIAEFISLKDLDHVARKNPSIQILVISADNDKSAILKALQFGVKGYLTKECSKDEVLMAIHAVAKGEKFFCHKILDILMENHFTPRPEAVEPMILTVREREILKLIAGGRSSQQIADHLHLSPHTVQTHRKSIIRKLNIKSPTEFVIYAMDLGLVKPKYGQG
jgi:two-component system, NarL family, invasion response regulator UvrY